MVFPLLPPRRSSLLPHLFNSMPSFSLFRKKKTGQNKQTNQNKTKQTQEKKTNKKQEKHIPTQRYTHPQTL